ncbi:hypothetical protein Psta_1988 [Pirellula staleyi DSM 6068]|uniref:Carboxypeptidase regulatory-like domain-containing protein n=1 Tax=Pirellula staleyi (strain ATCC 27377 / DSM 6068 / ICPB 4128) TaxID=530564 RepID=D2R0R4_PIRSD|nr:hypothetical protein [Pirellula staleyi]ADB16662.1 hypothetical protein Psta_1988 [Pirellula staleyi DSM 6068]
MSARYSTAWLLLALSCITSAISSGCGGSSQPRPEGALDTTPLVGKVTLQGTPVAGATVLTTHEDPSKPGGYATTDADGTFTLTTYVQGDGAVPGKHFVSVKKIAGGAATETEFNPDTYNPNGGQSQVAHELPVKYSEFSTSGLTVTVTTSGTTELNIDLQQ